MKRIFPLFVIWMLVSCDMDAAVSKPIVYNGDSLVLNTDFTRKSCGNTPKEMPEISGMSCSRVTPGYLWAQSDDNYRVIAMSPKGVIQYDITFNNKPSRGDWEDMCSGVYQGKQTIFVGGFGDNNAKHFKDNYIFYMEEPEISAEYTKTTYSVGANYIQFQYPDTTRTFDAEAMFYDNVDQKLFIVNKVEWTAATVFSLDMDTVYPNELQTLKEECRLGLLDEWQFQRVTAADITPDGHWIIIKNYDCTTQFPSDFVDESRQGKKKGEFAYALIWERKDGESVADALKRQPEQISAYQMEWQGEAVAWLDETTFYTTSDDDGSAPVYKYVRWSGTDLNDVAFNEVKESEKVMINGQIFIRTKADELYTVNGQNVK